MSGPVHPRASLVLLAYNQEQYARAAALSCLAQDSEPLEIVFSDDGSTDGTFAILDQVAREYRGPHRVRARRNERNLGIGDHYNRLLTATHGDLLVTAAADDLSHPQRVRRLLEAWDANGGRADLIASHVVDMDHDGKLHEVIRVDDLAPYRGVNDWAAKRPYIIGAGHAFTRRMMERFGPLDPAVFYEDQIMVFRAVVGGGAITVDEALVDYRRGGTSGRPVFESPEHLARWTERQRGRELAEMLQLVRDARIAGCETLVRALLDKPLRRHDYLQALNRARSTSERWARFRAETRLPTWWRLRKLLHVEFPRATVVTKQGLGILRRKRR